MRSLTIPLFPCVLFFLTLCNLSAIAQTLIKEPYPHLNSFTDGRPATCNLKPEDAAWLTEQMEKGNIRLATEEDIKTWEDLAKKKNRPNQEMYLKCGRTYTILKPMVIDKAGDTQHTFIVPKGVPFPEVRTGNAVYDINKGGWYASGSYDDGEKSGGGWYPDAPDNPFRQQK